MKDMYSLQNNDKMESNPIDMEIGKKNKAMEINTWSNSITIRRKSRCYIPANTKI